MSVVVAAIVGSAVVGAGSAYLASESASDASDKAVKAQERSANENINLQRDLAATQRADFEPWRAAGEKALQSLQEGIDSGAFEVGPDGIDRSIFDMPVFDGSQVDVTQDPGYDFRMQQGVNALDNSASSRGRMLSGAQQKGITNYAQNVASNEYANSYSRGASENANAYSRGVNKYSSDVDQRARDIGDKSTKFNILSSIAGTGQVAAGNQANVTSNLAQSSGNIINNLGRAQAQGYLNNGASQSQFYQDAGQTANQAAQNWLTYKNLNGGV